MSEQEIRAVIENWVAGIQARDLAATLANHTDDIVMFDVPPPQDGIRGAAAYRAAWPPFFDFIATGARFEIVELRVTAGTEVAFAHALLHCATPDELRAHPERRLRITLGLRREDGRWLIAHEHHSFPLEG